MKINVMDITLINELLKDSRIVVKEFLGNAKASDYFVRVTFDFGSDGTWNAVIPYIYRRSGLRLASEEEIAGYLMSIKHYFTEEARENWKRTEWSKWQQKRKEAKKPEDLVTIDFFEVLLSFKEEVDSFPINPNPQRRFQDIKDQGYTVSIYPIGGKQWGKMLLPLPLNAEMGYEVFTPQFKARVIRLFKGVNAYEAKQTPAKSLIPDHKFSEVRWDDRTKGENPMDMTDDEIIKKFQLLDNQRNQQKREVCRNCYQTGQRGKIFGIDYYYSGTDKWDNRFPIIGKDAEEGCIGCPWYDIEKWRDSLNELISRCNGND